jgi:glycerol-3-phosphate acyltransferase PlsY
VPIRLLGAYLIGAVPFSNAVSRVLCGQDLRQVASGTVSATNVYRVAGLSAFLLAGALDVGKGVVASRIVCGGATPTSAALVVIGHNWSPFLSGAGGRGFSPAIGALSVRHKSGAAVLLIGLVLGRLARQTALGSLAAQCILVPVMARHGGPSGAKVGLAVLIPMLVKRLSGNRYYRGSDAGQVYLARLMYDRDRRPCA